MRIIFGMSLDGAEWSWKPASLGEMKAGPKQFLGWLESRLGLDGVTVSAPERINEYQQKICRMNPAWCRASFELDPWSTAKQLLAWRDELVENGWDRRSAGTPRLETLAALEADPGRLSPGIPDRMLAVLEELPRHPFDGALYLVDEMEHLPYLWQQVIARLERCGMMIARAESGNVYAPKLFLVDGANEFLLAAECVRYLSSGENGSVALLCEGNSTVLDEVLHRNGFGRLGSVENSRWRESLQILPLWLETIWKPFHPQRFLELLLLPQTPVPAVLARELIAALQEEPGRGGEAWQDALRRAQEKCKDQASGAGALEKMWNFLEHECFRAEESVSAEAIINHCSLLAERLAPRVKTHPALALVLEHAGVLKKIVAERASVKRTELARILDSIISTGTAGDPEGREYNDFAVFSDPGMIDREFDTLVWWNFIDRGIPGSTDWMPEECAVMPGCRPEARREREHLAWKNALRRVKKNAIFFVPRTLRGEAVFPHPLRDELDIPDEQIVAAAGLADGTGRWRLADRERQLTKQPVVVPSIRAKIDGNAIHPVRALSYTQLETLFACPFLWFLQDYLGLKKPPVMQLPTGGIMLGNLAHKVIEEMYRNRETLPVEEAKQFAAERFDQLVPVMAAELLLDGRSVERKRIRTTLIAAVEALVREINSRKLLVKGTEKEFYGTFDGIDFVGKLDLYLEDQTGNPFVIDMKWSTSSQYERDLKKDRALQLAVYSWLLDAKEFNVRCSYFLFPKKKLLFEQNQRWGELWEKAKTTWAQRLGKLHEGVLERGRVMEEKDLKNSPLALPVSAKCGFCDYAALCAMMEEEQQHETD